MLSWIKALWVPVAFAVMVAVCYNIADNELTKMEHKDETKQIN